MAAFVEHEFEHGFILDEEKLRKITEIITSRIGDFIKEESPKQQERLSLAKQFITNLVYSKSENLISDEQLHGAIEAVSDIARSAIENYKTIVYQVFRGDFYFTTQNIQDVINEENYEWKKLEQIKITSGERGIFMVELTFTRKGRHSWESNKAKLEIEGEDRDFIYLLFSDLRQYISNEVSVNSRKPAMVFRLLTTLSILLALSLPLYVYGQWLDAQTPPTLNKNAALQSPDVIQKLNYLIQKDSISGTSLLLVVAYVVAALSLLLFSAYKIAKLTEYLFPENIFLFGKEVPAYNRKLEIRKNIFWAVIVASVISILTGLLVWWITK
jgi:hypothetical protein